jgi:hypothetical protein
MIPLRAQPDGLHPEKFRQEHRGRPGQKTRYVGIVPVRAKWATFKLTLRNARLNSLDGSWGWTPRVGLLT